MYWANFLHIYQPPDQMFDILERIVNESYRKLTAGLKKNPKAKITLNINAGLTEQLDKHKYLDLINDFRFLAKRGQIEFTESAKYHPFLPLTPWEEIVRQIKLNQETNKFYFGDVYRPKGFFPPEMAYTRKVADIAASLGYEWIIIDEIAFNGKTEEAPYNKVYTIKGLKNFKVFFRERRLSNLIMGAVVRNGKSLLEAMAGEEKKNRYLLTAMDGETFGHHRPGLEKLLFEILSSPNFKKITISEIEKFFPLAEPIDPLPATWSTTEEEIKENRQFMSWDDPENLIHKWQWEFTDWTLKIVKKINPQKLYYNEIRAKMDRALHSCQYWWASAKPWWSLEMIEVGAHRLLDIIQSIPDIEEKTVDQARDYYQKIVLKAFEWQRTGYIRKLAEERQKWIKIPFKERAKPGEYPAFLKIMEKEMKRAAGNQEFEKAIQWRDAITKLKGSLDIYDAVHVIDQLRSNIDHRELEKLIKRYKNQYKKIKSGQP